MDLASQIATWSKDPSKKVGAVIVRDKKILSTGYNGLPSGMVDLRSRLKNREVKLGLTVHAELNAILNSDVPLKNAILYVTYPPCQHCSLAIIQSGISKIVSPQPSPDSNWYESQILAQENFAEVGCHSVLTALY